MTISYYIKLWIKYAGDGEIAFSKKVLHRLLRNLFIHQIFGGYLRQTGCKELQIRSLESRCSHRIRKVNI